MSETRNYTLGRGEVYFAPFMPGTQEPGPERYLGNTPDLSWTAEIENLDHYSSDRGIREKDESVPLQVDRSGSVITDNIAMENLALFWFGSTDLVTVTAATGATETLSAVVTGSTYQLGMSDAAPAGMKMLSNVTATLTPAGGGTAVPLVIGTDFTVDLELGRLVFVPGGSVTGSGDESVEVEYDVAAQTFPRVISGSKPIEGALRFIAYNPVGKNIDYYLPWVKITPDGDYALKGDDWQQMTLALEILKKQNREAVYADGRPTAHP